MKFLLTFLLFIALCSCKDESSDVYGVWYAYDYTDSELEYIEAHFTDSIVSIVSNLNINYSARYTYEKNILTEYILFGSDLSKPIDTLTFAVKMKVDSMHLKNTSNPTAQSKWKKIEELKPFDYLYSKSLDSFKMGLRGRYIDNYLKVKHPNRIEQYVEYFDNNWGLNNQ
jgi:hypothetical protein